MSSAQIPEGMPPEPVWPVWRIRARRRILADAALLVLLVGFEIGIRQVSPDAVQVGIASEAQGHVFATREITDARTVADLFARINGLPAVGWLAVYRCPLSRPDAVMYKMDGSPMTNSA